jgi:hypothetical protein
VGAVLTIATDQTVLDAIKCGYQSDEYCLKIANSGMPGTKHANGLWYIGDCLLIPCIGDIHENLFHLAHDSLGHFGADKSYAVLCDTFYWPNMRHNLIPSCQDCQWNKSRTTKAPGVSVQTCFTPGFSNPNKYRWDSWLFEVRYSKGECPR